MPPARRKWWRRLFTGPNSQADRRGPIVGGDPSRRCFDGWLAKLIRLRDQTCRIRSVTGWRIKLLDCGFHGGPHPIMITTPIGHHYRSRAPDTS